MCYGSLLQHRLPDRTLTRRSAPKTLLTEFRRHGLLISSSEPVRTSLRLGVGILATAASSLIAFNALGMPLLGRIGMPHELCYVRDPRLIYLHVISDAVIGLAYTSISATLAILLWRGSRGIPFHGVFLAFGLFIVSCGFTHFMEIWVIWEPVYWLSGYVKVVTAAASLATAIALVPLVPKVLNVVQAARASEQRRVEIEQLNRDLEAFNSSVAHDLRTPLRGIQGYAQILQEESERLPHDLREYVLRIGRSAERMDALLADLLRYARIGSQPLHSAIVSLSSGIEAATAVLEAEIARSGGTVIVPSSLPSVRGDATLLQVVFQNLIGNALKFVAPGVSPKVEIAAIVEERFVVVTVTDNGVGIPPGDRERVFKMFERVHTDRAGSGVGLALVSRAIERMRGTIRVSDGPGGGTTFTIHLPAE